MQSTCCKLYDLYPNPECIVSLIKWLTMLGVQARSMTDKARIAAAGAMSNVRTAIDSAKRIGFTGNSVSLIVCS